jgi:hypothetical protein
MTDLPPSATNATKPYHVALSYAGEDRGYVEEVAKALKLLNIRVFYDRYEEASMWGKNLYSHLSDVYSSQAHFTVIFISKFYRQKLWTNHERESAQARALEENREYILPARFDETPIPGIHSTLGYIRLADRTPRDFAQLICDKLTNHNFIASSKDVTAQHDMDTAKNIMLSVLRDLPSLPLELSTLSNRDNYCQQATRDYVDYVDYVDYSRAIYQNMRILAMP